MTFTNDTEIPACSFWFSARVQMLQLLGFHLESTPRSVHPSNHLSTNMRHAASFCLVCLLALAFAAPKPQPVRATVDSVRVGSNFELVKVGVRVCFLDMMDIG